MRAFSFDNMAVSVFFPDRVCTHLENPWTSGLLFWGLESTWDFVFVRWKSLIFLPRTSTLSSLEIVQSTKSLMLLVSANADGTISKIVTVQ